MVGSRDMDSTGDPNRMVVVAPEPLDRMRLLLKLCLAMEAAAGQQQPQELAVLG